MSIPLSIRRILLLKSGNPFCHIRLSISDPYFYLEKWKRVAHHEGEM